jgi:hypothetical protein
MAAPAGAKVGRACGHCEVGTAEWQDKKERKFLIAAKQPISLRCRQG